MRTLSKEAEAQVIEAVKRAVDLVDTGGLTPTDAMTKVAREERWGAPMIRFASTAYNTGRQTAQRESASDALDKFASFPLANPEKVIAGIFPSEQAVKAAAADLGVSNEYEISPMFLERMAEDSKLGQHRGWIQKAAAEKKPEASKPKTASQVYNAHVALKFAADEARTQTSRAYDRLSGSVHNLIGYFRKSAATRQPFATVAFAASTYFGKAGASLLDQIYDHSRLQEPKTLTKSAALVEFDPSVEPFNLVQTCVTAAQHVKVAREAEKAAVDELERHVYDDLAPFVASPVIIKRSSALLSEPDLRYYEPRALLPFLPHKQREVESAPVVKVAEAPKPWSLLDGIGKAADSPVSTAFLGSGSRALFDKALSNPQTADGQANGMIAEMEDPAHDSQLRQIRAQAQMTDLMNDEVLGGYEPEQVMKAYNEISQLAPRTAQQPIAIRSLLRQHLTRAPETFEAQQLAQMEDNVQKTRLPMPPPPPPAAPAAPKKANDNSKLLIPDATPSSIV